MYISVPCVTSKYTVEYNEFEKSNGIIVATIEAYKQSVGIKTPNSADTHKVAINYDSVDVTVAEEVLLTTLPDFISAVGGNLGLFIGFSCLPVLLRAAEFIQRLFNP